MPIKLIELLQDLRRGRALTEAQTKLREVVKAVHETRKPGTLTIKLTISPGKGNEIEIDDRTKPEIPEANHSKTMFFADADGNVLEDDPQQLEFEAAKEAAS